MYRIVSALSFILRALLCYYTIETTPLFANTAMGFVAAQVVSIYVVLRIIAYFIVGNIFNYETGSVPVVGAILYAFVHVILVLLTWGLLFLLTLFGPLPLALPL